MSKVQKVKMPSLRFPSEETQTQSSQSQPQSQSQSQSRPQSSYQPQQQKWNTIVSIERFPDTNDPNKKSHKGLSFIKNDEGTYLLVADDSAANARIAIKPDEKELVNFAFQILKELFLKLS